MSSAPIVENILRQRLQSKVEREWNLHNPHLWADRVIGRELYEKHILEGGEWLGWQQQQIAFLTDLCDWNVKKLYVVCNRGGSKTWLTAVGGSCLIDNSDKLRVSVLSGSFDQASICYDYMSDIFRDTSMFDRVDGDITMKRTKWLTSTGEKGGGIVRVLPASTKRTKAPRADVAIYDEACEMKEEIIETSLPQLITAPRMKIIILTTPDKILHLVKDYWDRADELGFVRFHWTAFDCAWIPRENIKELYNLYDNATYRIMVLAEWTSKTGHVFEYADIQAALIDMGEIPPLVEMDRFFCGIDWGDAHETVATIVGERGNIYDGTDRWFVYDQEVYQREEDDLIIFGSEGVMERENLDEPKLNKKGEMVRGIVEMCEIFAPTVWSEASPISAFPNKTLRAALTKMGITMHSKSFTGRKHTMVKLLRGSFEKSRIKIPRRFRKLTNQLANYSYKEVAGQVSEEFVKKEDDHVDSLVWARWGLHPAESELIEVGEWDF